MKLEFFPDGSRDCPLVLLYGKRPDVVRALASALAAIDDHGLDLHGFPGIEPVGGCRVTARVAKRSRGIRQVAPGAFTWELTASDWEDVVAFMEPFCAPRDRSGFQWLETKAAMASAGVSFIISTGRHW